MSKQQSQAQPRQSQHQLYTSSRSDLETCFQIDGGCVPSACHGQQTQVADSVGPLYSFAQRVALVTVTNQTLACPGPELYESRELLLVQTLDAKMRLLLLWWAG